MSRSYHLQQTDFRVSIAELHNYPQIDPSGRSRYPYLASLRTRLPGEEEATHICGGVLVGPSHVLVAASCLFDKVCPQSVYPCSVTRADSTLMRPDPRSPY